MISKHQKTIIRANFTNVDTFPNDKDLQIEIGKDTRLIQPCKYTRYYVDSALINAQA